MNKFLSRYFLYYPATLLRGELVGKYLTQYEAMQWKDRGEIDNYQARKLSMLLQHAYDTVPYYKNRFAEKGIDINNINSLERMNTLPITTKSDIVQFSKQLCSTTNFLFKSSKTTGGSTGQAVTIMKNANALARERAATWRAYKWAGVAIGDVQARFWGTPITKKNRLLHSAIDTITNRVRLSAFNLNETALEKYYKTLIKLKPAYLYGYVSMIADLARYVTDNNCPAIPKLKSIITTSEVLDSATRKLIESVFNVSVYNEYGCGEVGSIAHECEYGSMHIMAENIIVEIDNSDNPGSACGKIIVTDLHNYAMPLIRYDIGDYGTLSGTPCECGRKLPVIEKIHGRAYDIIIDPSGHKHHPEVLMYIFEDMKTQNFSIKQFQVIQKKINLLEINIIPGMNYHKDTEELIARKIKQGIHQEMGVNIRYTGVINREKSGKLRVVKSEIK